MRCMRRSTAGQYRIGNSVLTGICAGKTVCGVWRQESCCAEPWNGNWESPNLRWRRTPAASPGFTVIKEPGGKPRIAGQDQFHYNLSHSGNRVVIAYGDSPVGADVQQMHMDAGKEALAKQFFTKEEQAYVFQCPELTEARFYQVWTGKESYLKYLGTGLKKSLESFSILSPEISPMLRFRILPDGYCLSLCSNDPNCVFVLDDQPFQ